MGRRRNKLRNAAGPIVLSLFRHEYRFVKIAHIGSSARFEISFICKSSVYFSAPPHFQLVPLHYVCSGDGTAPCEFY